MSNRAVQPTKAQSPKRFSSHGVHCLCDLYGVRPELLRDEESMMESVRSLIIDAGLTVLGQNTHRFPEPGGGFTGVLLLAESHASIHTYPEHCYAALDIFTCGSHDPAPLIEALCRLFGCETYHVRCVDRGRGVDADVPIAESTSEQMI